MTRRQKTVSRILEVKGFNKEQIEAEVKKAQERLNHEQAKLDDLEADYRNTSVEVTGKQMRGTVPAHEIDLSYTYLKHLEKQIGLQKKLMVIRAQECEERRKAMVEAYKEQRVFEILQDKIAQEQVRQAAQQEQKAADYGYLTGRGK